MSRTPAPFTKTQVKTAVAAVAAAGVEINRVEIHEDGKIVVVAGRPAEASGTERKVNEWDGAI